MFHITGICTVKWQRVSCLTRHSSIDAVVMHYPGIHGLIVRLGHRRAKTLDSARHVWWRVTSGCRKLIQATCYGANPRRYQITSIAINWIPHHWPIIKKIITVILNNVLLGIDHKIKLLIMTCAIKSTLSNKKLWSPSQYVFCAHKVSAAMPAQIARATSNLLVIVIGRR